MKKLTLTIIDRIVNLSELLPQKSNISNLVLAKNIIKKIEVTSKEINDYGLKINNTKEGLIHLDYKIMPPDIEFEFEDIELNLLREGVNRLNEKSLITYQNLNLCQSIMVLSGGVENS